MFAAASFILQEIASYEMKNPPGDTHSRKMKFVASDRARRENAQKRILLNRRFLNGFKVTRA